VPPESISDAGDPRLADYRNVPDPDLLRDRGVFIAEGRLVVRRLLTASRFPVRSVLVTETACRALGDVLAATPVPVYVVPPALLGEISGFNVHRGCLAVGERQPERDWRALAAMSRRLVILEHVGDPDNVGSIFRNAVAFGADGVLLDEASTDPLYRKAIRTSMGAALSLPFARMDEWPGSLAALREQGFVTIGLVPSAPRTIRDVATSVAGSRIGLLLGHEGEGLSPGAMAHCDHLARIPMAAGIDSLNVATAAAVALYELEPCQETGDRRQETGDRIGRAGRRL
jgi:tRNA G18 (ribose-2'-O)-methylase SpoU